MIPSRYTSIIIATHTTNSFRSQSLRESILSLIATVSKHPVEIIVIDNACIYSDSMWLFSLVGKGHIQCYIQNQTNMHFGYARNQGFKMAHGNYIVIADDDIYYRDGWFEACIDPLEIYPDKKIYSTPLEYPTGVLKEKYDSGKLFVKGKEYNLNMRAGSNCFMIRRSDFETIGLFKNHRIAGSKWTDEAVRKGYLAAVSPDKYAYDLGLRAGYNHGEALPIRRILTNREEVYFNEDNYQLITKNGS